MNGIHGVIRADAGIERGVLRPRRGQPGHAAPGDALRLGERAAHENALAGVHRDGEHRVVEACTGIEREIQRAVRVQPRDARARHAVVGGEIATDDDLAIRLKHYRIDRPVRARAGGERDVHRAIRRQPNDAVARRAVEERELARHERPPAGVNRHRARGSVSAGTGIEGGIHAAGGQQAGHTVEAGAVEGAEPAADEDFAIVGPVGVNREGGNVGVRAGAGVEGGVDGTVDGNARDAVARRGTVAREVTDDDRAAEGVQHHGVDRVVRAGLCDHGSVVRIAKINRAGRRVLIDDGDHGPSNRISTGNVHAVRGVTEALDRNENVLVKLRDVVR